MTGAYCLGRSRVAALGRMQAFRGIRQRLLQRHAHDGKLFRPHQLLHAFKQLAFFLANVGRQFFHQGLQAGHVQFAGGGAGKEITQQNVSGEKFLDQRLQFRKSWPPRETILFLRRQNER